MVIPAGAMRQDYATNTYRVVHDRTQPVLREAEDARRLGQHTQRQEVGERMHIIRCNEVAAGHQIDALSFSQVSLEGRQYIFHLECPKVRHQN